MIERDDRRACERVLLLAIVLAFLASFGCAAPPAHRATDARGADAVALAGSAHALEPPPPLAVVTAVGTVGMTVGDLDRSVGFYTTVLGFERVPEAASAGDESCRRTEGHRVRLRLGDEILELTQYARPGRPVPADSRSLDGWFQHVAIIVSDIDRAYQRLQAHHVRATTVGPPQRLPDSNPPAAGIAAYYFKDPDGHPLEILHFPADKGAPKWHRGTDALFLGIDHTAIVVRDTERSLRFYRDTLGMRVTGGSVNLGSEQEHLSGVPGARVEITSLHAANGPGIELLEYLAPRGGRPLPADVRVTDLFHWETVLVTADADAGAAAARVGAVKPQIARAFDVRDPDGHVMRLIEENESCR